MMDTHLQFAGNKIGYKFRVTFNNDESDVIEMEETICHGNRAILAELFNSDNFR